MANEPIDELNYAHGLNVVDIGDLRVSRGLTRRPATTCRHKSITYDPRERRIWCRDCEQDIDPFDAFTRAAENYDNAYKALDKKRKEIIEAEQFQIRTIAAKNIDKVWRSRNYVPACPHCNHGLFPESFKNGVSSLGRDYAEKRLSALKGQQHDK